MELSDCSFSDALLFTLGLLLFVVKDHPLFGANFKRGFLSQARFFLNSDIL